MNPSVLPPVCVFLLLGLIWSFGTCRCGGAWAELFKQKCGVSSLRCSPQISLWMTIMPQCIKSPVTSPCMCLCEASNHFRLLHFLLLPRLINITLHSCNSRQQSETEQLTNYILKYLRGKFLFTWSIYELFTIRPEQQHTFW